MTWADAWHPLIEQVGTEIDGPEITFGPERVEAADIRRYLEPLEFDCALHYDVDVARKYGWPDLIAPYTSAWSFVFLPTWQPGAPPAFAGTGRDEQPRSSAMTQATFASAPPTTNMFGTNASYEFARPPIVGDRLGLSGRRLLACVPKETSVGTGAFVTISRRIVTDCGELICGTEVQMYLYNPHMTAGSAP